MTCDWGGCSNDALLMRRDGSRWLPICLTDADGAEPGDLAPLTHDLARVLHRQCEDGTDRPASFEACPHRATHERLARGETWPGYGR